jgi:tRNA-dihydrouridine synthase
VEKRRRDTKVSAVMIGRAAMMNPWVFREAKHYLEHGKQPAPATAEQRIGFMRRHVELAVGSNRYGSELQTMRSMRSRLMNYTKFLPGGKWLRMKFSTVSSVMELEDAVASYFTHRAELAESEVNSA